MIFLRYENLRQYIRLYPLTCLILLIQTVLYILMEISGDSTDPQTLLRFGAMFKSPEASPEYWRYFTSIFLHIGFDHLLFNSFALFVFAPPLEKLLGKVKYIVFYLGSGFAGNAASEIFTSGVFYSAGASGAIYGIYAAFLYLALFRKHALDAQSKKTIKVILIIGLIYSVLVPQVSVWGHIGGFLGGFALFSWMCKKLDI